jgi:hypothetical protein
MLFAPILALLHSQQSGGWHRVHFEPQSPDSRLGLTRIHRRKGLLVPIVLAAHLGAMPAWAQSWEQSKLEEPPQGKTYYQFVLRGKYLLPPAHPDSESPRLVVFCGAGKFAQGQFLPGAAAQPLGTPVVKDAHQSQVNLRLDDENTSQALWEFRNDGMALGFDQLQLKRLLGHPPQDSITKRVIVGIHEALGGEVVVQFDMPRNPAIILQTCGLE